MRFLGTRRDLSEIYRALDLFAQPGVPVIEDLEEELSIPVQLLGAELPLPVDGDFHFDSTPKVLLTREVSRIGIGVLPYLDALGASPRL